MEEWQIKARERIDEYLTQGDYMLLWNILSVSSNKISREYFRTLKPESPSKSALSVAWLDFLDELSGGVLKPILEAEKDEYENEEEL